MGVDGDGGTGRVWARAPGSLALKLWASAIWDDDPPRPSGPPPPADEARYTATTGCLVFPTDSQQFLGGGGQWARGRFVEASLCDDASTAGGSIEAGVERAQRGSVASRRSQERVGSRVQRIGDYRYPAEGSLADKVGTWGTFWRPAMRTADGDRKVATWALQLPVSRCLPALGNAAQLSSALVLSASAPCGRMGGAADTALLGRRRGELVVRGRRGARRRRGWDWDDLELAGTKWLSSSSTSCCRPPFLPRHPSLSLCVERSPTVASVEAARVACRRSCSADIGGVRRLMSRQLELAQRVRCWPRPGSSATDGSGCRRERQLDGLTIHSHETDSGRSGGERMDCHSNGTGDPGNMAGWWG